MLDDPGLIARSALALLQARETALPYHSPTTPYYPPTTPLLLPYYSYTLPYYSYIPTTRTPS